MTDFNVAELLAAMSAPPMAIEWAKPFGGDFRGAWESCEHPEIMLPLAAGMGVPPFHVVSAAIEVVRMSLPDEVGDPVHPVRMGLYLMERFICNEADEDEILGVIGQMGVLAQDNPDDSVMVGAYGSVSMIGQGTLMLWQGEVKSAQYMLSMAPMFAMMGRVDSLAKEGALVTEEDRINTLNSFLSTSTPLVRTFLPFESLVSGFFGHAWASLVRGRTR